METPAKFFIKSAAIFGALEPYDVDAASIPYKFRKNELKGYLNAKSQEAPTSYGKAIGVGGLSGGLMGAILGAVAGGHPVAALLGGGIGAGLGGLAGGIAGLGDRYNIESAKNTLRRGNSAIDQRLHENVRHQRAMAELDKYLTEQRRHEEMMGALRRDDD